MTIMAVIGFALLIVLPFLGRDDLICCKSDPVGMAQQTRPEKGNSRALCEQHDGYAVLDENQTFIECIGGE